MGSFQNLSPLAAALLGGLRQTLMNGWINKLKTAARLHGEGRDRNDQGNKRSRSLLSTKGMDAKGFSAPKRKTPAEQARAET
jgi:hypothetical protein